MEDQRVDGPGLQLHVQQIVTAPAIPVPGEPPPSRGNKDRLVGELQQSPIENRRDEECAEGERVDSLCHQLHLGHRLPQQHPMPQQHLLPSVRS